MIRCDTCNCRLPDDHPFGVCPSCLFEAALRTGNISGVDVTTETKPAGHKLTTIARLPSRKDFFDKYELLRRVAQGGQGDVWEVRDFELRRFVALKRLNAQAVTSEAAVHRFLAEAQIASQLEHPGILPIFDVGLDPDGRPFYTTQLLPGETLGDYREWSPNAPVSGRDLSRALEIFVRVCEIIGYAHSRGVIHRDLKPSNILLGPHGDVRVIDWGSAHILPESRGKFEEAFVAVNAAIETDRTDVIHGFPASPLATGNAGYPVTVLFMPPEILRGNANELGPSTDIYSLGVILYELLSSRAPYCDADGSVPPPVELRERILRGPPVPVRKVNLTVSRDLAAICEKAMAHSKAMRYESTQTLADDIRAALENRPVKARRPGPLMRLQKWARRHTVLVLLGCASVVIVSAALSVAHAAKAERDAARQITALRGADLEARSGHWREALKHLDEAEAAGYGDATHLNLQRAEAWTVLNEPSRSKLLLVRLERRSAPGAQRGAILLRLGEHELFDQQTYADGVDHVRSALAQPLSLEDQMFAKGLLADSTPEALGLLREVLRMNPYHHGAHRHSLGLEFLLGQHKELQEHIRIFKVLYPDDPSAGYIEAANLALQGRTDEALARLDALSEATNLQSLRQVKTALGALAEAAKSYNPEIFLRPVDPQATDDLSLTNDLALVLFQSGPTPTTAIDMGIRFPQLPCVRKGVLESSDAMRSLAIPFLSNPKSAVEKIKAAWKHHPEATVPALAGIMLGQSRRAGEQTPAGLLQLQVELFRLAADSPSMMPYLGRLSRYLAAKAEFDLAGMSLTNSSAARVGCLKNLRRASEADELSSVEGRAFFNLALALAEFELSRSLLKRWEAENRDQPEVLRANVELDIATGAFGNALARIDQMLDKHSADRWAIARKNIVVAKLKNLLETISSPPTNPTTQ